MSDNVIARVTTHARRKGRPHAPWSIEAGKPYPADHGAVREHPHLFATPDAYAAELLEKPNVVHGVGAGYRKPERQTKSPGETSDARAPRAKDYRAALDDAGVDIPKGSKLKDLAALANANDVDVDYGYAD